jgi:hypothetical protein
MASERAESDSSLSKSKYYFVKKKKFKYNFFFKVKILFSTIKLKYYFEKKKFKLCFLEKCDDLYFNNILSYSLFNLISFQIILFSNLLSNIKCLLLFKPCFILKHNKNDRKMY